MIESRGRGLVVLECDGEDCGAVAEPGFVTFQEAVEWAKENGWAAKRNTDGTWNNFCPNCAVDMGLRKPFPDGARAERPPTMAEMQEYICLRQRDGKVKKVHMPTQTYHNNEPLFQPRKKAT